MKKILSLLFVFSVLLSLVSCGDGYKSYTEGNVSFRLPDTLEKKNVSYADVYYSDRNMYVMIMAFSNKRIVEELELHENITVSDYVTLFKSWNGYTAVTRYDEERDCVHFAEVTKATEDYETADTYDYYLFFRREGGIYVFRMNCEASLKDEYEAVFKYIDSTVVVE